MFYITQKCYFGDQVKKSEIGEACGMYRRQEMDA